MIMAQYLELYWRTTHNYQINLSSGVCSVKVKNKNQRFLKIPLKLYKSALI